LTWSSEFLPVKRFDPENDGGVLPIEVGDSGWRDGLTCKVCGGDVLDCCYNCEAPFCREHLTRWFTSTLPGTLVSVCPDCENLLVEFWTEVEERGEDRPTGPLELGDAVLVKDPSPAGDWAIKKGAER